MKIIKTALGISSFLALASGSSMIPSIASADTVERTYVACNQYGECWRVHQRYSYPSDERIVFHDGDWYAAHQSDEHVRWLSDPADDRGWYERDGRWHADPGVRAVKGGAAGAAVGAAIGCVVTLPAGCAPGAAVGAAVGGGTGAVAGAASTPHD
jgi:hypothetical protein